MLKFKILSILMAFITIFCAGCNSATTSKRDSCDNSSSKIEEQLKPSFPDTPHMSERIYIRPDKVEVEKLIDEIFNLIENKADWDTIKNKRSIFYNDFYSHSATAYTIADLNYYKDITSDKNREEMAYISDFYNYINNSAVKIDQTLFTSEYKDDLINATSQSYCQMILNREVDSEKDLALLKEIQQLEGEYGILINQGKYEKIADIYKSMILKRNEYAKSKMDESGNPYKNYLDYVYDVEYNRTYSPLDTQSFKNGAVEYILPVVITLRKLHETNELYDFPAKMDLLSSFMPRLISETVPEMQYSWDYMMEKGLYDFEKSSKKMEASFVINFSEFDDGFLFINPRGTVLSDLKTLIHEFGHYNEIFMHDEKYNKHLQSVDLAETHSQCYELLTLDPLNAILKENFGDTLAKTYMFNAIFDSAWAILSNCVFDEFEKICYNSLPEQLNNAFFTSTMDKLFTKFWGESALDYYEITHIFTSPGYCISYPVSMTFASEIWASENNIENYKKVVEYGTGANFDEVYKAVNLECPLNENVLKNVGASYINFLKLHFNI